MKTWRAAAGSFFFLLIAPGSVAGLIPWLITRWQAEHELPLAVRLVGFAIILPGVGVLLHAFLRFVLEGAGTPVPVAPTERLVVGGLYAYARNPMYLAVLAIIVGQALLFAEPKLVLYALGVFAAFFTFVRLYEEPKLERTYGAEYLAYKRSVAGWWPRRPNRT